MVKLLILACAFGMVVGGRLERQMTNTSTGQAPSSTVATNTLSSSSREHGGSGSGSKSKEAKKEPWFGKELNIEDVEGCKWPSDFQERFSFCANRTSIDSIFSIQGVDGAQFGILDKEIASQFLDKCSSGDCSKAKINQTQLVDRAELWWHHMGNVTEFSKCLKKNTEGMVRLCGSNDEVSQTVSGIAGLHLNIIDALSTMHKHVSQHENHTDACLAKLSEAIHFTSAAYLTSHFYSKNQVQCWDVTKGDCTNPLCKQFVYILTCLQSVCPVTATDLAKFGIWEWHFTDVARSKRACGVQIDNAQCQSDSSSILSKSANSAGSGLFDGKPKELYEKFKVKVQEAVHNVEDWTHLKFYQVALICLGVLALFIGLVTALCMWYHGLICKRRKRRVLRYSKLVPEDRMGQREEESKSLTRDYDDVE